MCQTEKRLRYGACPSKKVQKAGTGVWDEVSRQRMAWGTKMAHVSDKWCLDMWESMEQINQLGHPALGMFVSKRKHASKYIYICRWLGPFSVAISEPETELLIKNRGLLGSYSGSWHDQNIIMRNLWGPVLYWHSRTYYLWNRAAL